MNPEWADSELKGLAVDSANAWIARFAPLVMDDPSATVPDLRKRIETAVRLQQEVDEVHQAVTAWRAEEPELADTFEKAAAQLPSLEDDLRRRLARLAPGDPQGIADYRAIQDRLSEREARQELGVPTEEEVPSVLELDVAEGNWAAAGGLGVFAFGWNSFTLFHCVLMVGGMTKAFGWGALALLGFYAIFFGVGFLMIAGAFMAASKEAVRIDGDELTSTYRIGRFKVVRKHKLALGVPARVGAPVAASSSDSRPKDLVVLTDPKGREFTIGQNAGKAQLDGLCAKINAYMAAQADMAA